MAISDLPEGDLTAAASVPAEGVNEAKPRRVTVTKLAALLHGLVQPEASPEPAGLHVGVSDGFAESRAGSVAGQDVVVMLHPMSAAVSVPPEPSDTTPPTLGGSITIGTVTSSSIHASWPAGADDVAVTSYEVSSNGGSSYTDVGNVLTYTFSGLAASTSYSLRVRAKDAAGNVSTPLSATQSTSAAPSVPTSLAITGSATGVDGSPTTITGTLDAPATVPVTVTPTAAAGATFSTPAVIGIGQTSTTWTVTRATSGTAAIAATTSPALTVTGGYTYTSAASAWTFSDGATQARGRNTTTALRTGMAGTEWVSASPDLLPGERLSISGGTLSIVADSTTPTVDGSASGSLLDTISARDVVIEVIDTADQHATAQNTRTGTMYGRGAAGARINIQKAIEEAQDGDTLQISPGAIWLPGNGDGTGYLEGAMLAVYKSLTLTNVPGRGRWSLAPPGTAASATDNLSGIVIWEPSQTYATSGNTGTAGATNPRKTIVLEGFDFSNWGRTAADLGVKVRSDSGASAWTGYHASVTFRNFKVGKPAYQPSASGFGGSAEALIFDDGHVYDCGGGTGGVEGNDHNFYITARNLTMQGVRSSRSRANSADGLTLMDGHLAKLTFNNADIQGCVFDAGPYADSSVNVQCKGGGNLTFRGNLVISGPRVRTATGAIVFEKEAGNFGGWMFGLEGHSLLVEKNVFVSHLAYSAGTQERAMVYFRPAISSNYLDQSLITACVIRDNIGMSTVPSSLWVQNPPASWADANWAASNTEAAYGIGEPGFSDDDKALLLYRRLAGTIAATGGSIATKRFVWPHGYVARTDAFRGLA